MKKVLIVSLILFGAFAVRAQTARIISANQDTEFEPCVPSFPIKVEKPVEAREPDEKEDLFRPFVSKNRRDAEPETQSEPLRIARPPLKLSFEKNPAADVDTLPDRTLPMEPYELDEPEEPEQTGKFHWKPAIAQSMTFLGIQHSLRMLQTKTTRELKGPFFRDWGKSVRNLSNWRDGDSLLTNYIAHPMQGAVTGRIFINNSDLSNRLTFANTKEYWSSRLKAMVWSAAWSTQFELGPLSEASIGNVGLYDRRGPNLMGWVDLVVTPTAGTGVIILEDIIDKYIVKDWLEKKIKSQTRMKLYRTFITPFQSFTNVLQLKVPWHRDNR